MSNQTINRVSSHVVLGLSLFAMFLVSGATILTILARFGPKAKDAVPCLIQALGDEDLRNNAASALQQITGLDFGEDAVRYQQWWDENQ